MRKKKKKKKEWKRKGRKKKREERRLEVRRYLEALVDLRRSPPLLLHRRMKWLYWHP